MAINNLLRTVNDYLHAEQAAADSDLTGGAAGLLQVEVDRARKALDSALETFVDVGNGHKVIRSVLVAVDGSEPAGWALDEAGRLAEQLDASVSLVHVIDVPSVLAQEFIFEEVLHHPPLVRKGWDVLHAMAARVPPALLSKQLLSEGKAEKEILVAAHELPADLIVIGTHGRGLLGRFLLGSVAEAVVRHATCPVLAVGHPRVGVGQLPHAPRVVGRGTVVAGRFAAHFNQVRLALGRNGF